MNLLPPLGPLSLGLPLLTPLGIITQLARLSKPRTPRAHTGPASVNSQVGRRLTRQASPGVPSPGWHSPPVLTYCSRSFLVCECPRISRRCLLPQPSTLLEGRARTWCSTRARRMFDSWLKIPFCDQMNYTRATVVFLVKDGNHCSYL
jgi:hypothetical protein